MKNPSLHPKYVRHVQNRIHYVIHGNTNRIAQSFGTSCVHERCVYVLHVYLYIYIFIYLYLYVYMYMKGGGFTGGDRGPVLMRVCCE